MARAVGLRTEILTTLTLLMGAALLLGGFLMLRLTEQSLLGQRLTQLDSVAQVLGTALIEKKPESSTQQPVFSIDLLKSLPDDLQHTGWWLYDQNLNLLASYRTGEIEPLTQVRLRQIKLSQDVFRSVQFPSLLEFFGTSVTNRTVALPLLKDNRFHGLLEIHFSLDDIRYRLLLSQRLLLVYVVLYGAVLVFIGYYLLQRNVIRPARNLLAATEEVGRGNLETRLPVAGPLEISRLAQAYNNMSEALKESRQETQAHIEALQQTNSELQVAREELIRSEKLASVGQLAAGLAHEIGNPLTALIGYLEILKMRIAEEETQDIVLRSLVETQRIDFLVRELLDFSKPSQDSPQLFEPVSELKSVLDLLSNQGIFTERKLAVLIDSSLPNVFMGKRKFQQILINLLLNAVQATSMSERIEVSGGQDESFVWLTVSDCGSGIKQADLSRIFDPFFTTKDPGCGTGLGLAVCYRLVEEAGGSIEVKSTEGVGSQFKLLLPVAV